MNNSGLYIFMISKISCSLYFIFLANDKRETTAKKSTYDRDKVQWKDQKWQNSKKKGQQKCKQKQKIEAIKGKKMGKRTKNATKKELLRTA